MMRLRYVLTPEVIGFDPNLYSRLAGIQVDRCLFRAIQAFNGGSQAA